MTGTVPVDKLLLAGTVLNNKFFLAGTPKNLKFQKNFPPFKVTLSASQKVPEFYPEDEGNQFPVILQL